MVSLIKKWNNICKCKQDKNWCMYWYWCEPWCSRWSL